jgi:hypothetical protein
MLYNQTYEKKWGIMCPKIWEGVALSDNVRNAYTYGMVLRFKD